MELPYWGTNLQTAMDVVGSMASPPGGGGNAGLFEVSMAAVTFAAIGTTTYPALYNPPASGKLIRIMRVLFGDESGTLIRAHMRYYRGYAPGVNVLSGITDSTANIQSRSRQVKSIANWYTALTCTPAATTFMPVGLGSGGAIAAQFYNLTDNPQGIIVVWPGEIWYPAVSNGALAMVGTVGVQWLETPIPQGN